MSGKVVGSIKEIKPDVPTIELKDGIRHEILFDMNALVELEDAFGGTVQEAFEASQKGYFKAIRAIIYAGLSHEEPALSLKEVGRLIDFEKLSDLGQTLQSAADSQMGTSESLPVVEGMDPN